MRALPFAVLALLSGGPAGASRVTVEWQPLEKRAARVVVEFRDASGAAIARHVLAAAGSASNVELPKAPPGATLVDVSTPLHAPCRLQLPEPGSCVLTALTLVRPFGSAKGRLWVRASEKEPFREIAHLEPEWGEEADFPLPPGRLDLIAAPEGAPAQLFPRATPDQLRVAGPSGERPVELRGRLVDEKDLPFKGRYELLVERLSVGDPAAPMAVPGGPGDHAFGPVERRAAWADFYRDHGILAGKNGTFRVTPLADDELSFAVKVPDRPDIRFGTGRPAVGRILDVGALRVLSGGTLVVKLSMESRLVPSDATFKVSVSSNRMEPGTRSLGEPRVAVLKSGRPLTLDRLTYGTWDLTLALDDLELGTERVTALPEKQTLVWRLTDETVAGAVVDLADKPLAGAEVAVQWPPRAKTRADEDGRFAVTFPHAGGDVFVAAKVPGQGTSAPHSVKVDPRSVEARDLRFRLPGFRLLATVRSANDGKPVPGADVFAHVPLVDKRGGRSLSVRADEEGHLALLGLPAGTVSYEARAKGFAASSRKEVTLSKERPEVKVEIELEKAGTLAGSVVDGLGRAIPGAMISGPLSEDRTEQLIAAGPDGRFEAEAPSGPSIFAAWGRGFRLGFFSLTPGPDPVTIALLPIGLPTDVEVRQADGSLFTGRPGWTLLVNGFVLDDYTRESAFRMNSCAELYSRLSQSQARLGGCLMPGMYSLLVFAFDGRTLQRFRTEGFDPTTGGVQRVAATPLGP